MINTRNVDIAYRKFYSLMQNVQDVMHTTDTPPPVQLRYNSAYIFAITVSSKERTGVEVKLG